MPLATKRPKQTGRPAEARCLKLLLGDAVERAYRHARREAADETGLAINTFPDSCPYAIEEIRDRPLPFE
jgi:hypothetical protein